MQVVGESPMASQMPPAMKDSILHSVLAKDGLVLMASDLMTAEEVVRGNTMSLCVIGSTKAEIAPIFARLAAGGEIEQPLQEEFFGTFGELTDKFGMNWVFQADKSE